MLSSSKLPKELVRQASAFDEAFWNDFIRDFPGQPRLLGRHQCFPISGTPKEQFVFGLQKVKVRSNMTRCWEWVGRFNNFNYGVFSEKGRPVLAHRRSWELFVGKIPRKKSVLHKCDNPRCVNPRHLFIGTQRDNVRDAFRKGRLNHIFTIPRPKGEAAPHSKLTEKIVLKVRSLYTGKHGQITKFGPRNMESRLKLCGAASTGGRGNTFNQNGF